MTHRADVHDPHNPSHKAPRGLKKRKHGCTESVKSVLPTKILTGTRDCYVPKDNKLVGEIREVTAEPAATPFNIDRTASDTDDGLADMET